MDIMTKNPVKLTVANGESDKYCTCASAKHTRRSVPSPWPMAALDGNVARSIAPCIVGVSSMRTPSGENVASKRCGLITAPRGSQ